MRRAAAVLVVLLAAATPFAAAPFPSRVEALFSRVLYPAVAGALAHGSGVVPFALAEAGAVVLLLAACFGLARLARARPRHLGRAAARAVAAAALAYLAFLLCWGLNYRRLPFAATSGLDARAVGVDELAALAAALVHDANALRADRLEDGGGVFRASGGPGHVLARAPLGNEALRASYPALAGPTPRPKRALLSFLMPRVGIAGIYVPFTAEPLVDGALPQSELPFSAAHEVAHAQGFAREDEANFVGYLACARHPDGDFRYSGALVASFYVLSALAGADAPAARALEAQRSGAVRRDIAAIVARNARHEGPLRDAGERVNDAYLRSQGAREGVRSYGRMVDLLIAVRRPPRERVLGSAP